MLKWGIVKYQDTSELVKSLGLKPSIQQDAQEYKKRKKTFFFQKTIFFHNRFFKLLITLLEEQIPNLQLKELVKKLFQGEYKYVTKCSKCQNMRQSPATFYELEMSLEVSSEIFPGNFVNFFFRKTAWKKVYENI